MQFTGQFMQLCIEITVLIGFYQMLCCAYNFYLSALVTSFRTVDLELMVNRELLCATNVLLSYRVFRQNYTTYSHVTFDGLLDSQVRFVCNQY